MCNRSLPPGSAGIPPAKIVAKMASLLGKGARRYTQVPSDQKRRHSGRDCRNPEAMEGKLVAEQVFDFVNLQPTVSHPCGLDSGNPCRNDVPPTLVYNGERSAWECSLYRSCGSIPPTLERRRGHSHAERGNDQKRE